MKLVKARVTNYRCIEDSGWVEFDTITALVGKNESGKTAFIQALHKLYPLDNEQVQFDYTFDYPKKGLSKYKKVQNDSPVIVVEAVYSLSDQELRNIESVFGKGVLQEKEVTVSKNYKNELCFNIQANEKQFVKELINRSSLPADYLQQVRSIDNASELISVLEELPEESESVQRLLESVNNLAVPNISQQIWKRCIQNFIPKFVYFDEYSVMEGSVSLPHLKRRIQNKQLEPKDETILALLNIAGTDIEELQSEKNYERLKAELESASISITNEVFEFWSQNKELRVNIERSDADPAAPAPLNQGPIIHTRIWNNRHNVSVPFGERSKGFVWFFSFLAYFSDLREKDDNLIILLDEPGLNLHAKAQGDFLRFIDERLAVDYQVVYTTHSPFMRVCKIICASALSHRKSSTMGMRGRECKWQTKNEGHYLPESK